MGASASARKWVVECPAHTAGPFPSREAAEALMASVTRLGACMFDHAVAEVGHA